jgi:HK97 family phage prohead protease
MSKNGSKPDEEIRFWPTALEVRNAKLRRIGGLGVPYGTRSALLPGGFFEVVETRALAKTLGDKLNVTCLLEHHPEWLLASSDSGTLRLDDQADGLHYEADLPNTGAGNDTYELVQSGRIKGSSMGFQCYQDEFRRDGATIVRHLVSIRLGHVAPTAQPAYPSTVTAVRSLARQIGEDPADVESLAAQGELRSLFMRTDQQVSAPPTVEPAAEHRSDVDDALALRRRINAEKGAGYAKEGQPSIETLLLAHRLKKANWDAPPPKSPGELLLDLHRRKSAWDADTGGTEARSLPGRIPHCSL